MFFIRKLYKYSLATFLVLILLLNLSFVFLTGSVKSLYHFGSLPDRIATVYYYAGYSLFDSGFFVEPTPASEISSYIYNAYAADGENNDHHPDLWSVSAPLLINAIVSQRSNYDEMHVSLVGGMGVTSISPAIYAMHTGASPSVGASLSPFDYRENIRVTHEYLQQSFQRFGTSLEITLGLFLLGKNISDFTPSKLTASDVRTMVSRAGLEYDFDQILYSVDNTEKYLL